MVDVATSRRDLCIYELDFRYLVELLGWWNKLPSMMIRVPKFVALPLDAVVVSVHENYSRQCLDVVIASKKFPQVPDGEVIPRQRGQLTHYRLAAVVDSMSCESSEAVDG